jgi:hypothetical protein
MSEGKIAYQSYVIEHGIEKIAILVPVDQVEVFEEDFAALKNKRKTNVMALVESVGGKVRG